MSTRAPRWPATVRWGLCFALALCFHVAAAAVLLARWNESSEGIVNAPVITVELAPRAEAPPVKQVQSPPGPQQTASLPETKPQPAKPEHVQSKPAPAKTVELSVLPPRKPTVAPKEEMRQRHKARVASAPSSAKRKSIRAAAPAPGAVSPNPFALPNWKSALMARLERYKRYPLQAQARGDEGVVQLAFKVDRQGRVHGAHILRSSGSTRLDRATLSLLERAQPLPAPPAGIHGTDIAIVVPIRYSMR